MAHLKTLVPTSIPVTLVDAEPDEAIIPVPLNTVHVPVPIFGILP